MLVSCPNCKSSVAELLACDGCEKVGCIRCITRFEKKWMCKTCKSGGSQAEYVSAKNGRKSDPGLFGMFG